MEGITARRDTYIRLLRSVTNFDDLLSTLAQGEPPDLTTDPARLDEILQPVRDLLAEVDVNSQHREVGDVVRQLLSRSGDIKSATSVELPELASTVRDLVQELVNVCRWDLGSYASPPGEHPQQSSA